MSNIGFAGVANFAMTTTASAVRVMGVAGTGSATEVVQWPSLGLNFLPMTDAITVLDPRITFSRTSNATVTGSNGLIQYAPHNLLTFSEQFDNSYWGKNTGGVLSNVVAAPDGTLTADKLVATTSVAQQWLYKAVVAGVSNGSSATFSCYMKLGEYRYGQLRIITGSAVATVGFDLQTGTIYASPNGSGTITPVGNGWYRCTATGVCLASTADVYINVNNTAALTTSFAGNGTDGIYLWGAQLEIGSTATTYNPTTVKNLLGYSQNFENAAWTKSNSFVQTNLQPYSQDYTQASWNKQRCSITANSVVAPDGTTTATTITEDTSASITHGLQYSTVTYSNSTYTVSVYVKAKERSWALVRLGASADSITAYFDVANGVVGLKGSGATAATITTAGNGWWRCTVTGVSSAVTDYALTLLLATGDGGVTYTGNGTSGIYAWGAQLVQGSTAGDYQATTSAAAAVQYAGPFGYLGADKLVEDASTGTHLLVNTTNVTTVSGTTYTLSVYAKAAERAWFQLAEGQSVTASAYFNLASGSLGTVSGTGSPSASIKSVGNGWYLCSLTFAAGTASRMRVYTATGDGGTNYTGDGTSGIYVFGAQLSDSASLDPYVYNVGAAPSAAAYYGPRFDYDPVTLAPKGLLIEEQRTNLILNSVMAGGGSAPTSFTWTIGTGTSTPAASTASTIGVAYTQTATAQRPFFDQSFSGTAGTTYAVSFIIEATDGVLTNTQVLGISGITPTFYANGVSVLPSAVAVVGRLTAVFTAATTTTYSSRFGIGVSGAATGTIRFSCPQVEAGSFATSYIPTVASQVTRAADNASMQGTNFSQWYNQSAGTFAFVGDTSAPSSASPFAFAANDGTTNNRINVYATGTSWGGLVATGGVTQATITVSGFAQNAVFKSAVGAQLNSVQFSLNGALGTEDTSATLPVVDRLSFGQITSALYLNGHIQRLAYYPRRLTNAELQSITA